MLYGHGAIHSCANNVKFVLPQIIIRSLWLCKWHNKLHAHASRRFCGRYFVFSASVQKGGASSGSNVSLYIKDTATTINAQHNNALRHDQKTRQSIPCCQAQQTKRHFSTYSDAFGRAASLELQSTLVQDKNFTAEQCGHYNTASMPAQAEEVRGITNLIHVKRTSLWSPVPEAARSQWNTAARRKCCFFPLVEAFQ